MITTVDFRLRNSSLFTILNLKWQKTRIPKAKKQTNQNESHFGEWTSVVNHRGIYSWHTYKLNDVIFYGQESPVKEAFRNKRHEFIQETRKEKQTKENAIKGQINKRH